MITLPFPDSGKDMGKREMPAGLPPSVTRGYGFLENYLARLRTKEANRLIAPHLRSGRILDIGCGEFPYFLLNSRFRERYGVDKIVHQDRIEQFARGKIVLANYDAEGDAALPFPDGQFDVVTMLAVLEHIEPGRAARLVADVRRVLRPGGMYILTTPAAWSHGILRMLAKARMVSRVEIQEHKAAYTPARLLRLLEGAGFRPEEVRASYFKCLLNLWATGVKR